MVRGSRYSRGKVGRYVSLFNDGISECPDFRFHENGMLGCPNFRFHEN